ncbi:SDR family NAD(P)-dependent oxidoreductase [Albirhodobacter sp. R86504]|uniref:SDR family NAD(P)-dependent oxidoreductase n=1 Tax=Albirhodobacter sp. R86504 TaxID=3093848 RepID=UPI00366CDBB5
MKRILITGATDGLGRATAQALAKAGHALIIHGRNAEKLAATAQELRAFGGPVSVERADLSDLAQVAALGDRLAARGLQIDVLINNAGVLKTAQPQTPDGMDVRFTVNTLASAMLAMLLLPVIPQDGRIIHLSSAAQAPVNLRALEGHETLKDMEAYAQSKLAITLWNQCFADTYPEGPVSIAVNPGSLLATRMVREGFGTSGNDLNIGVDILTRAALSPEFSGVSGRYFDNDARSLAARYPVAQAQIVSRGINELVTPVASL